MKLSNLAVAARMRLLIGMMLFGLIALCAVSLGSLRTTMMEDRKVQTKHLVESGASILLTRPLNSLSMQHRRPGGGGSKTGRARASGRGVS